MSSDSTQLEDQQQADQPERFRVLRPLGEGMLGTIFEAALGPENLEDEPHIVALKSFTHYLPDDLHLFQQEFEALCRLEHPGLARFHELLVDEDHFYVIRDLCPGRDLTAYLERDADDAELEAIQRANASEEEDPISLDPFEVLEDDPHTLTCPPSTGPVADPLDLVFHRLDRILPDLLAALEYLHRFRKVHGNLKPSNIIVDEDGKCCLVDYGLVPHLSPEDDQRLELPYEAPEIDATGEVTVAADLFALGAILYEAITGRCPERSDGKKEPVFLSELAPGCPAGWVELIHGLLLSDPDRRPSLVEIRRLLETTQARSVEIPPSIVDEHNGFLGRTEHLETLIALAKSCAQNRQMALTIVDGATGVGKSALVDALGQWASQRGWLVVRGKCHARESVPFQGWDEIIRQLAYLIDQLPEKIRLRLAEPRRRASALFPILSGRGEVSPDTTKELVIARTTTTPMSYRAAVLALRRLIAEVARQRPILISLDDIHLASADTSRLMADFLSDPREIACLVVTTRGLQHRVQGQDRGGMLPQGLWRQLEAAPIEVHELELAPFSKAEARQYVMTAAPELELSLKQEVLRQGALHPLLLEELIYEGRNPDAHSSGPHRAIETSEAEKKPRKKAGSPKEGPLCGEALVDARITEMVKQRLAHLSRSERLVLQLLAVASSPLSTTLIGRVIAVELGSQYSAPGTAQKIAEELVSLRLAKRTRGLEIMQPHLPRYVVRHDVGRKIILAELGRDHHARLCHAIADAVELHDPDRADLRFEYLQQTSKTAETAQAAREAATNARRRFAFHRASRLWRWIVEHVDADEPEGQQETLKALARCEYLAGRFQESALIYESLAGAHPRGAPSAALRLAEARAWLAAGEGNRTAQALEAALTELGETLRPRRVIGGILGLRLKARNLLSWSNLLSEARPGLATQEQRLQAEIYGFVLDALPYLPGISRTSFHDRFVRLARHTRDQAIVREAYFQRTPFYNIYLTTRPPLWPEALHRQIKALLTDCGDDEGQALYGLIEGTFEHQAGHYDRAASSFDQGEACLLKLTHRDESIDLWLARAQARLAIDQADFARAEHIATVLLHHGRDDGRAIATARAVFAEIDLLRGAVDAVAHHLDAARNAMPPLQDSLWQIWLVRTEALWNLAMGRPEVAVAQLELWIDQWGTAPLRSRDARVLITLTLGQCLAGLAEAQRLLSHPRQGETHRHLKECLRTLRADSPHLDEPTQAAILRLMARFEMLRDRPQRAMRHAHAAIAALEPHPRPIDQGRCAEVRGLVLLRLEKAEARQAIEQARALYTHHGVQLPLILEGWPVPRHFSSLHED